MSSPEYEIHEYCDIFPDLDDKAIAEMADSIAAEGQLDPIVRWGNIILDGKNRLRACKVAGVVPVFESWAPTKPADKQLADDEAWAFCRAKNYNRRHLTTSQLSMIAGKELDRHCANLHTETTVQEVADKHGVSKRSVDSAKKVIANGSTELQHAVTNGHVTVSDAASIVDQPKPKQNAAVKAVTNGHAKTVNEAVRPKFDPDVERLKQIGGTTSKQSSAFDPSEFDHEVNPDVPATKVDKHLTPSEKASQQVSIIEAFCRSVMKHFDDNLPKDPWLDQSQVDIAKSQLRSCLGAIRVAKAGRDLCPKCHGKGCASCRKCGYLPKLQYEMLGGK